MLPQRIKSNITASDCGPNNHCYFSTSIEVYNYTTREIFLIDRNNACIFLKPEGQRLNNTQRGISVRVVTNFRGRETVEKSFRQTNLIRECLINESEALLLTHNSLKQSVANHNTAYSLHGTVFFIPESVFLNEAFIHDEHTGLSFTTRDLFRDMVNPESTDGKHRIDNSEYVSNTPSGFLAEIVDNENQVKERFMYMLNQVVKIPVKKDPNRSSGLYITNVVHHGNYKSELENDIYLMVTNNPGRHFTDGEKKYGIYPTMEEATSNGNPELVSKRLLKEKEEEFLKKIQEQKEEAGRLDLEHRKTVAEMDKKQRETLAAMELKQKELLAQYEERAKEREERIAKLKEELDERKQRRNDYYESRSSDRKDTSEMIKFIPAVLAGFVGAALLFRK